MAASGTNDWNDQLAVTRYLWRGSLLLMGREAAPESMGLLRSPAGASSLATGVSLRHQAIDRHQTNTPLYRI